MSKYHQTISNPRSRIPCKYFSQNGDCPYGNGCHFSHSTESSNSYSPSTVSHIQAPQSPSFSAQGFHPKTYYKKRDDYESNPYHEAFPNSTSIYVTIKPHCPSLNIMKANFSRSSLNLLSTKPLLHIVVLYAGDINVRKYIAEIMPKFLKSKIHCFLQMNTPVSQENEDIVAENDLTMEDIPNMHCSIIKPEHLLQIITGSNADFLVVIGDRNMKQKTCQSKRNGKLIPTLIDEEIKRINEEWSLKKVKNPLDHIISEGIDNVKKDDILKLFQWITNVRNIKGKVKALGGEIKELSDWYTNIAESPELALLGNEERLKELTRLQNSAMRTHREVFSAKQTILNIPADDEHAVDRIDGLDLTYITDFYAYQIGISTILKEKLLEIADVILRKVENMCNDFSVFPNKGPLWKSYFDDYTKESSELQMIESPYERLQTRYWSIDYSQRSRSSSNVSRSDSEHSQTTIPDKSSTSSANVIIASNIPSNSNAPSNNFLSFNSLSTTQQDATAWKSQIPLGTTYSNVVQSSKVGNPNDQADHLSIHTDDVSSMLSSRRSSTSDIGNSFNDYMSGAGLNLSNHSVFSNNQPTLGNNSPANFESNTWQNLSTFETRKPQSFLSISNGFGQTDSNGNTSFQMDSRPQIWQNNNSYGVSRFANNSQLNQTPNLFNQDDNNIRNYIGQPFINNNSPYRSQLLQNPSNTQLGQSSSMNQLKQEMGGQGLGLGQLSQSLGQSINQDSNLSRNHNLIQGSNVDGMNSILNQNLNQGISQGANNTNFFQNSNQNMGQQIYSNFGSDLMSGWGSSYSQNTSRFLTNDNQNTWNNWDQFSSNNPLDK